VEPEEESVEPWYWSDDDPWSEELDDDCCPEALPDEDELLVPLDRRAFLARASASARSFGPRTGSWPAAI
jgi:hypothetical protein